VLLPAWYTRRNNAPLPLVISPHGRGVTARANARNWGALPTRGAFAVVNPEGEGRKLTRYSWGYRGQIDDLARMPSIVAHALPWLRIDRTRIYAFGSSMGGQETLLLAARHPRLLAGAAAFDSVTDLRLQYWNFRHLRCSSRCRRAWGEPLGRALQELARLEVGGAPRSSRGAFARRSPLAYASRLASSCVPLQLWWSVYDRIVVDQHRQSGALFERIAKLNPTAPVEAYVGFWRHSRDMQARTQLPLALSRFGLLPEAVEPRGLVAVPPPANADCSPP
jgi:pimeloyl-ACP methyl ester carboxylesterase